jgi:hypothetical protein
MESVPSMTTQLPKPYKMFLLVTASGITEGGHKKETPEKPNTPLIRLRLAEADLRILLGVKLGD